MVTVSNSDSVSFKLEAKCGEHRALDAIIVHHLHSKKEIWNV